MKKAFVTTLLLTLLGSAAALPETLVSSQITDLVASSGVEAPEVTSQISESGVLRGLLWNYINNGSLTATQPIGVLADKPFYRQQNGPDWHLFPALPSQSPTAYLNRRLGLPVHGRWISTYVNQTAFPCIKNGFDCQPAPGSQTRDLRVGSIIVKENYPNVMSGTTVAQRSTPGVLTVMWKPYAGYCGTRLPFNGPPIAENQAPDGPDCFGGEWVYAFYILRNPVLNNALKVQKFDDAVTSSNNSQAFCINCHGPAYRADYLRGLLAQWREPVQPGTFTTSPLNPGNPSDFCIGPETLSSKVPTDVPINPWDLPQDMRQQMFDCFSWRSFIALSWPGSWDDRGNPQNVPFADFGNPKDPNPAVWQTYRATWEVFQPNRGPSWVPPRKFNEPRPAPAGGNCPADEAGMLVVRKPLLTQITKGRSAGLEGDVGNETGQAFAGQFGTLADRNGTLVRYEVSMNPQEFNFLVGNTAPFTNFALNQNLTPGGPANGAEAVFPNNSIEIKAGWKELCTDPAKCLVVDDPSRYFAREVIVYDEQKGDCEPKPVLMGLVGLHVIQKTFWAPQWIWSTFEQIDNVPFLQDDHVDQAIPQLAQTRFNDASCQQDADFCVFRPFLVGEAFNTTPAAACCPNVTLNRFADFGFFEENSKTGEQIPTPNQLTRLDPIQGSGLNQKFQQQLAQQFPDSPFKYYVLVNTQWPLNGRDFTTKKPNTRRCAYDDSDGVRAQKVGQGCYTLVPEDLRNSVVESYMADYYNDRRGKPEQRSNRSCLGCHGDAGVDFSYIFLDAVEQRVPIQLQSSH